MDSTLFRFPVTVGVASGSVYFLYRNDPFGWPVDAAARLQSKCSPGEAMFAQCTIDGMRDTDPFAEIQSFLSSPEMKDVKPLGDFPIYRLTLS